MGPHTLIKRPHNLDEIVGRPTGQGYGAADYQQGKAFRVED